MNASAKPFTILAAVFFLLAAGIHIYRLYSGFPIVIGRHAVPVGASWAFTAFALLMGVMLLRERRR